MLFFPRCLYSIRQYSVLSRGFISFAHAQPGIFPSVDLTACCRKMLTNSAQVDILCEVVEVVVAQDNRTIDEAGSHTNLAEIAISDDSMRPKGEK